MITVKRPTVSILTGVYNAEDTLKTAAHSIMRQTIRDWQWIVVDDGSTDRGLHWLKQIKDRRIVIVELSANIGLTRALNHGLQYCEADFVARLDADDLALPHRLECQLGAMKVDPKLSLCGSRVAVFGEERAAKPSWRVLPQTKQGIEFAFLFGNPFAHSSVMFRKADVLALGNYDENLRYNQDFALWSSLLRNGYKMQNLNETLVYRYRHPNSVTALKPGRLAAFQANAEKMQNVHKANYKFLLGGELMNGEAWRRGWVRANVPHLTEFPVLRWRDVAVIRDIETQFLSERAAIGRARSEMRQILADALLALTTSKAISVDGRARAALLLGGSGAIVDLGSRILRNISQPCDQIAAYS